MTLVCIIKKLKFSFIHFVLHIIKLSLHGLSRLEPFCSLLKKIFKAKRLVRWQPHCLWSGQVKQNFESDTFCKPYSAVCLVLSTNISIFLWVCQEMRSKSTRNLIKTEMAQEDLLLSNFKSIWYVTGRFTHGQFAQNGLPKVRLI